MSTNRVWVVEMYAERARRWEPCAGVGLSKHDGATELREWRRVNPGSRFRLVRYVPMIAPRSRP